MPLKIDVTIGYEPTTARARAEALRDLGVDGAYSFENAHDVFFPLVLAADVGLELMTNVAIAFPRSPLHLAYCANDLQLLTGGKFRLGIGSQVRPHVEKRYGSTFGKPVAHMREWVEAIKAIYAHFNEGEPLQFRGEYTTHTLMTPNFNPGPNPHGPPPVLVAALGPKMNEMAAEVADGVLVMPFNSDRHMRERTLPAIDRGLATAGRTRADYEIASAAICAIGRNDEELAQAAAGVKGLLAFYGSTPSYKPVLDVEGWGDLQPELNTLSKRGEWKQMAELIDDAMLRTIGLFGSPKEVGAEIVRRFGDNSQRVQVYFPGYPIADDSIGELCDAIRASS